MNRTDTTLIAYFIAMGLTIYSAIAIPTFIHKMGLIPSRYLIEDLFPEPRYDNGILEVHCYRVEAGVPDNFYIEVTDVAWEISIESIVIASGDDISVISNLTMGGVEDANLTLKYSGQVTTFNIFDYGFYYVYFNESGYDEKLNNLLGGSIFLYCLICVSLVSIAIGLAWYTKRKAEIEYERSLDAYPYTIHL